MDTYTLIYDPTAKTVVSLAVVAGKVWPPTGKLKFLGTLDQCDAEIAALGLTPLPDPVLTAAKTAKLKVLTAALNTALTAVFSIAPIQAQAVFSNLAGASGSITKMIDAGHLTLAQQALQGMLDDDLIPAKYSALITTAIAAITAAAPNFTALSAATTVDAVQAVS